MWAAYTAPGSQTLQGVKRKHNPWREEGGGKGNRDNDDDDADVTSAVLLFLEIMYATYDRKHGARDRGENESISLEKY